MFFSLLSFPVDAMLSLCYACYVLGIKKNVLPPILSCLVSSTFCVCPCVRVSVSTVQESERDRGRTMWHCG